MKYRHRHHVPFVSLSHSPFHQYHNTLMYETHLTYILQSPMLLLLCVCDFSFINIIIILWVHLLCMPFVFTSLVFSREQARGRGKCRVEIFSEGKKVLLLPFKLFLFSFLYLSFSLSSLASQHHHAIGEQKK
jgi:hypothetical protein